MQNLIFGLVHCAVLEHKKKNGILMVAFSFLSTNDLITEKLEMWVTLHYKFH